MPILRISPYCLLYTSVLFVKSEAPYHERKVTLLNGPHTVLSTVAYLSGVNIVRDACNHPVIGKYRCVYETVLFVSFQARITWKAQIFFILFSVKSVPKKIIKMCIRDSCDRETYQSNLAQPCRVERPEPSHRNFYVPWPYWCCLLYTSLLPFKYMRIC